MVANPDRRSHLATTALEVLGRDGARAVTHRAVDTAAGLPTGSCVNYFPTRAALFVGMAQHAFRQLAPDPQRLTQIDALAPGDAGPEFAAYVVERLLAQPHIARALIELRLEAARNDQVAAVLGDFFRAGLTDDIAFHEERDLAGGRSRVLLLHHLVNGIVLDALTIPLDPSSNPAQAAQDAARALGSP